MIFSSAEHCVSLQTLTPALSLSYHSDWYDERPWKPALLDARQF